MNKKFLLTYSYTNWEGMCDGDYRWYETKEKMKEDINDMAEVFKDFKVVQAIELICYKNIKLN